jgi:hypothetical protein
MAEVFGHPWMQQPCASVKEVKEYFEQREAEMIE